MTLPRVNPGGWLEGNKITPAQINGLDINVSKAIDGDAGGSYTLSAPLSLTANVEITGASKVLSVTAGASLSTDSTANTIIAGRLILTGSGGNTSWRSAETSQSASATIDTALDVYYDTADTPRTVNTVLTLRSSTAPLPHLGNIVRVSRWQNTDAFTIVVKREDGTTLATFPVSVKGWCSFMFVLGNKWIPLEWGGGVTV